MVIRVLLVDDHVCVRQGYRGLLEKEPDIKVIGEAGNGDTAIRLAQKLSPDVILLDIVMPNQNGIETARRLSTEFPHIKVVALSMHTHDRFVSEMFKAGTKAYLAKSCNFNEVLYAIRRVVSNEVYLSSKITSTLVKAWLTHRPAQSSRAFSLLTSREREVLQLIAECMTTKEIAANLNVGVRTVVTHRQNIMGKLDIHNIAGLTKYALREKQASLEI